MAVLVPEMFWEICTWDMVDLLDKIFKEIG
jgi:hypothetical protein